MKEYLNGQIIESSKDGSVIMEIHVVERNNNFAEFAKLIVNLVFKNAKFFKNKYIQTNVCMI